MAMLAFRAGGVLRPDAEVLGVGAGNEPTVFELTRHVRRVFATDLYAEAGTWDESAAGAMLTDPGRYWRAPWNPRRLVVQHMDGRDLRYEDGSFDGVFSSSSIEHFGDHSDVTRALNEMHRVLRPGGVLSLSTEFRIAGPGPGLPNVLMFDATELESLLFGAGRAWAPLDGSISTAFSEASRAAAVPFSEAASDVRAHVAEHGAIYWDLLRWTRHPQLALIEGQLLWTSIHAALRKP